VALSRRSPPGWRELSGKDDPYLLNSRPQYSPPSWLDQAGKTRSRRSRLLNGEQRTVLREGAYLPGQGTATTYSRPPEPVAGWGRVDGQPGALSRPRCCGGPMSCATLEALLEERCQ